MLFRAHVYATLLKSRLKELGYYLCDIIYKKVSKLVIKLYKYRYFT